ncbi:MAG TPA: hypothetical protein VM680_16825 [Verrucomicrobiae bacterium]|nr:hypothetical protein [Verrucomicrobiae bacterium]
MKCALAAIMAAVSIKAASPGAVTGPSSSQSPYVLRSQPGVVTMSVLSVGDAVNFKSDGITPYRLAGIPDGLGAFDNGDGTFTLLVNQELGATAGIVRDHGFKGAFVSRWVIDKETLTVLHGEDLIKNGFSWDVATKSYVPLKSAFARFCSADLPAPGALYDAPTGLGFNGHIFLNGEENGSEGRAFGHLMDGNSYELPYLGKFSWENSVANPGSGARTVVAGTDDAGGGQIYIYVGTKSASSNPIDAAGLNGGALFGVKVTGFPDEIAATGIPSGTPFTLAGLGDVSAKTGATLQTESVAAQITGFNRPEDASWDPSNPNDLYFVTTASFTGNSRLWRLRFTDITNPELGGTIDLLLDGAEGQRMFDNMTVNKRGSVLLQEDVGNNAHLGKIWRYSIAQDRLEEVAHHDPVRFLTGAANFLTQDEESSGIIPMDDILGAGWYLLDVQAHYNIGDAELVEGGQIIALHFPPGKDK